MGWFLVSAQMMKAVYGGHMKRIRTHELKPGMVVASDVYNRQDQLVIPAETVLTEKVISKLSIYNIYFSENFIKLYIQKYQDSCFITQGSPCLM